MEAGLNCQPHLVLIAWHAFYLEAWSVVSAHLAAFVYVQSAFETHPAHSALTAECKRRISLSNIILPGPGRIFNITRQHIMLKWSSWPIRRQRVHARCKMNRSWGFAVGDRGEPVVFESRPHHAGISDRTSRPSPH